jgi:hypothetical protein
MTALASFLDAESPTRIEDLGGGWDKAILAACQQFTLLDAAERGRVRSEISRDRGWALIGWAERMASLGVRLRSRDVLILGLVGLSLFDQSEIDTRDAEVVYALFVCAAELIDSDPLMVAKLAAEQTDPPGRVWLLDRMPSRHVGVPPTHYEEGEGATFAFCRRQNDWDPEVELRDFLDKE